jgi:hypothetical protein
VNHASLGGELGTNAIMVVALMGLEFRSEGYVLRCPYGRDFIWILGKSRCQFETSSQEVGRRYIISFSLLQQPDDVILTHIMY